jgi:flagellar biosynthetic protein FliP
VTRLVQRLGIVLGALLGMLAIGFLGVLAQPVAAAPAAPVAAVVTVAAAEEGPVTPAETTRNGPAGPSGPAGPAATDDSSVVVELDGLTDKPSSSVSLLLTVTLLSLAPALLLSCTCFTKILIVLGLTRNALGLQQSPPNQVLVGLALFLSLFIMAPVLSDMNDLGLQPYLDGQKTSAEAFDTGVEPLRTFMLKQTGDEEIELLANVAERDLPADRADTPLTTLVPAFILSELKQAFIIGFIIFIPFLVIDLVVSGALMALGMMMMPPVMVSLPFKLLLFVLVNGWGLVITSLVASYQ